MGEPPMPQMRPVREMSNSPNSSGGFEPCRSLSVDRRRLPSPRQQHRSQLVDLPTPSTHERLTFFSTKMVFGTASATSRSPN
jgi:hypothetical protein